ncbi:MAG: hypothetical protein JO196_11710 [Hyphomicrobiales bacterium]|nr:hypothetical protein [Hyphomicrobiales bacterium]
MSRLLSFRTGIVQVSGQAGQVEQKPRADAMPAIAVPASALRRALAFFHAEPREPDARPLSKIRARHAALGFPYWHRPEPPSPVEPTRNCDCVPWRFF